MGETAVEQLGAFMAEYMTTLYMIDALRCLFSRTVAYELPEVKK